MSVLGEVFGGHHQFHHKGKEYKVSLFTNRVQLAYERALFARARAVAQHLPEDERKSYLAEVNSNYTAGKYQLQGEVGQEAGKSVQGVILLISLLFNTDEEDALKLIKERSDEVTSLIKLIMEESLKEESE